MASLKHKKIKKRKTFLSKLVSIGKKHPVRTILGFLVVLCSLVVYFLPTDSPLMPLFSAPGPARNVYATKDDQEKQERERSNKTKLLNYAITGNSSPVIFWDNSTPSRIITIQNNSDVVFSSNKVEGASYDIIIKLRVTYQDQNGDTIGEPYEIPLREQIMPTKNIFQEIPFHHIDDINGTVEITLICGDAGKTCDTSQGVGWSANFSQGSVKGLKIILIDATREDDYVEMNNLRTNFYTEFGLSSVDGDKILKAMYSKKSIQEKQLSGAIILANPKKYPGDNDVFIQKMKELILRSYTHIEKVLFLPYDDKNFSTSTYLLSDCAVDNKCASLIFSKLDTYKNPFSKKIFVANPDMDLVIIIPAASDKKKEN